MAKRLKAARVSDNEDRLSLLPDDILVDNILSLLTTKEATRTSILSRRWRFLWLCAPSLDFDASEEVARVHPDQRRDFFKGRGEAASKYAEWVDYAISAYRGPATLRQFRVLFRLDGSFSRKMDSWLRFCLARGVRLLELDCLWEDRSRSCKHPPCCRFPSISPGQYPNLRLLKSLILRVPTITSDSLNDLLQGSEFLERLELCDLHYLEYLNVTGPMSRLKTIRILRCYYLMSITISAPTPDLASFIYPRFVKQLHLEHAPKLVDLYIAQSSRGPSDDFDLISHPLFSYVSQLEALHLEIRSWHMAIHWLPHLLDLRHLRHLKLTLLGFRNKSLRRTLRGPKLHGVASLISAASCLQHLTLEVDFVESGISIRETFADLKLQHVRVIEILGFRGRRVDCELVLHLIKAAAASPLEKVIIDCRSRTLEGCFHLGYQSEKRTEEWKSRAKELLEPDLPSEVELVLLSNTRTSDMVDS